MKKSIFLIIAIMALLVGCSKPITTYRIMNNVEKKQTSTKYLDGTMWEVVVFCKSGEKIVRQDNIDSISPGLISENIECTAEINGVQVSFKFLPEKSEFYDISGNVRKYTVVNYTILPETDNLITIDSKTMLSNAISVNSNFEQISFFDSILK